MKHSHALFITGGAGKMSAATQPLEAAALAFWL